MDTGWIEIFRTGTWTDSAGRSRTWTKGDLARIAQNYDPDMREAPLVLGHPKDNAPAYGWVERLKVSGDRLYARLKQVPQAVKDLVAEGRYKKRSISLYPDGTLRHVGLLGAVPPAIPGLKEIGAFSSLWAMDSALGASFHGTADFSEYELDLASEQSFEHSMLDRIDYAELMLKV